MKKILAVIGLGMAVGATAYLIWDKLQKEKKIVMQDTESESKTNYCSEKSQIELNKTIAEDNIDYIKHSVANNIIDRHKEAAQIIENTVAVICKRSEVSEDEMKELEEISGQLKDLLREE